MSQHRRTSSLDKIVAYWREAAPERLPGLKSDWIGWGEPFCFRCGWLAPLRDPYAAVKWSSVGGYLERAHLQDHAGGGGGEPGNLVPLCHLCHRQMPEHDDADLALVWVASGSPCDWLWQMWTDHRWGSDDYRPWPGSRVWLSELFRFNEVVRDAKARSL